MGAGQLGYFIGSFFGVLILPVIWLLIAKAIQPLRTKPGITYGIAIALAILVSLAAESIVAGLLCGALLFWQYKRAASMSKLSSDAGSVPPSGA